MKILKITPALRSTYQSRIAQLEKLASYPLGTDSFQIDHGSDYFAFFDRMGATLYAVALEGDQVVAVAAGILREMPVRAWYLCDLKVHPDYRKQHIPLHMLSRFFIPNYLKCRKAYAISMNPHNDSNNRIAKLLSRFRWASSSIATQLSIYSFDAETVERARATIEKHRGPFSFLSLAGKKDLILKSTGLPLPLLHFQFGGQSPLTQPQSRFTHMLCCPEDDPLQEELQSLGLQPGTSATVIHHRMADADWKFISTSEI